jgi:hypothetical protein
MLIERYLVLKLTYNPIGNFLALDSRLRGNDAVVSFLVLLYLIYITLVYFIKKLVQRIN